MVEAALLALAAEWEGFMCPICADKKWRNFPFCRRCSIRLQRVGMMARLKPYSGRPFAVLVRRHMAYYYDLCRDYLAVSKRLPHRIAEEVNA